MKFRIIVLATIIALFHTFCLSSQSITAQFGVNLSSAVVKVDDNSIIDASSIKPKKGVVFGGSFVFQLKDQISLELSPSFISKGFIVSSEIVILNQNVKVDAALTLNYLELPIMAHYAFKTNKVQIIGLLGSYVSVGVGGKGTSTLYTANSSREDNRPVNWGNDDGDLKRLDFGLMGGFRVKKSKYSLTGLYSLGIPNVFANRNEDQVFKNSIISLMLGYTLKKTKSK
jgi:hypothetical protein